MNSTDSTEKHILKVFDIDVEVTKKKIKHTYVSVLPPNAEVRLSIPDHLSDQDAEAFLLSQWVWINRQRENIFEQNRQTEREFVGGESHYLFGQRYRLDIEYCNVNYSKIEMRPGFLVMRVRKDSTQEKRDEIMWEYYRTELRKKINDYLQKWIPKLGETEPYSYKLKRMKNLWGSCVSRKRSLLFNLELARVPLECIEYVVVHELTHLKVPTHSKAFETLMNIHLPNWRSLRTQLNEFIALPMMEE